MEKNSQIKTRQMPFMKQIAKFSSRQYFPLYGIGRDDLMVVRFRVAEKSGRPHPFKESSGGRAWLDGFLKRHPTYLCIPLSLYLEQELEN